MPDNMNERRALCRVARLLHQNLNSEDQGVWYLVANIDPANDPVLGKANLTQLDGLLLGPKVAAILEFKNYFDPIDGQRLRGRWFTRGERGRQEVVGGSSLNPYLQAKQAKSAWVRHLGAGPWRGKNWYSLHSFVLFHPYLHGKSTIAPLGRDHYWLTFRSIDDITELAFSSLAKELSFTPGEMQGVAFETLRARPWGDMDRLLAETIGDLCVLEPGQEIERRYALQSFDEFTIGRAAEGENRIRLQSRISSRRHVRMEIQAQAIRIYDMNSKNGTYLRGRRVDSIGGVLLQAGDVVHVGRQGDDACKLWFEPLEVPAGPVNGSDETRTAED